MADHWAQQLKANIKLVAEIVVPLISICVAVYLAFRNCRGWNKADPGSPNEGPTVFMVVAQSQMQENESATASEI